MSSETVIDHHSEAAPEQLFDVFFNTLRSLHHSFIAIFFVFRRYMVHDSDHEIPEPNLHLFDLLFNSRCLLMRKSFNYLSPLKAEFNEPHKLE